MTGKTTWTYRRCEGRRPSAEFSPKAAAGLIDRSTYFSISLVLGIEDNNSN